MPRAVSTPQFTKCLRALGRKGKIGKNAKMKALAAKGEADESGQITVVKTTNHGESRIPNVEKFDLGAAYRLVVQLVDSKEQIRAFLFAGDHDDTERWLDNHRNYKWVRRDDNTLDFVKCSDPGDPIVIAPIVDDESPESLLEMPLLRDLDDDDWTSSKLNSVAVEYLKGVSTDLWEQDASGVIAHVSSVSNDDDALFVSDLLEHAHKREWQSMRTRLSLRSGESEIVTDEAAAAAMLDDGNSEKFVTWDDTKFLENVEDSNWADWMLFMHPEQKKFANKDFNGPTRLRGVSGSGKTCVMVHRARRLARMYQKPILLVTLTDSMRALLQVLVKDLCFAESANIRVSTMSSLTKDIASSLDPVGFRKFTLAKRKRKDDIVEDTVQHLKKLEGYEGSRFQKLSNLELRDFVYDETDFVRQRLTPVIYEKYLKSDFKRYGRGSALAASGRVLMLKCVEYIDSQLTKKHLKDAEGFAQFALDILSSHATEIPKEIAYRAVLVDEVQDLSQIELSLLSMLPDQDGNRAVNLENGLFLVGDGAQTIYKKGFALSHSGINVNNRSFNLQKNYRNTREILEAAYDLISGYEFADIDESNIGTPTEPHLSSRHGEKPMIVKCSNDEEQAAFVSATVAEMQENQRQLDEAEELEVSTELPICVIGFNKRDRDSIQDRLNKDGIATAELRDDVTWDSETVKISTLESAKGHEFHAVFIVGVHYGTIPNYRVDTEQYSREASRLYVAMTRARDKLFLSYTVGAKKGPSPFLPKIQGQCLDCEFKRNKLLVAQ